MIYQQVATMSMEHSNKFNIFITLKIIWKMLIIYYSKVSSTAPIVAKRDKDQSHAESNSKFKSELINYFDMLKFIAGGCVLF